MKIEFSKFFLTICFSLKRVEACYMQVFQQRLITNHFKFFCGYTSGEKNETFDDDIDILGKKKHVSGIKLGMDL